MDDEEEEEEEDVPRHTSRHSKTKTHGLHTNKNDDDDSNAFEDFFSKRRKKNRKAVEEEDVFEDRDTARKRNKGHASKFERVDIRELPSW